MSSRSVLAASGEWPPPPWYREVKTRRRWRTRAAFLGTHACAQKHHHPFEKWSRDYYSLRFFSGGRKPL